MFDNDVLARLENTRKNHVLKDRLNTRSHRNRSNFLRRQSKATTAAKRRTLLNTANAASRDVSMATAVHKGALAKLRELRQRQAEEGNMDPELVSTIVAADDARARAWNALLLARAKKQDIQLPKGTRRKRDYGRAAPGKNYEPHDLDLEQPHLTSGEDIGLNGKSDHDSFDIEPQPDPTSSSSHTPASPSPPEPTLSEPTVWKGWISTAKTPPKKEVGLDPHDCRQIISTPTVEGGRRVRATRNTTKRRAVSADPDSTPSKRARYD
jgi:hypothetical protein